jgi:uncharacterized membrane protein YfcA
MSLEILLIAIVIFIASALQGVFGFAFMLIALPLLSYFMSLKAAVPLLSLLFLLSSIIQMLQLRGKFTYRNVMSLLIGAVFGIPIGIFFILELNERLIKAVLGFVLIAYSVYSLLMKRTPLHFPEWTGYLFGFLAGVLGGTFNMTGPPLVFYISGQQWKKINIVGSLNFFFFITTVLVIAFHIVAGNVTQEITIKFLILSPVMVAGLTAGLHIFKRVNEDNYRKGLFVLLMIMGIMLMLSQ